MQASYSFPVKELVRLVRRRGCKRVLLQAPNGLKYYVASLARSLEEEAGVEVFVSTSSTFGPCDVDVLSAHAVGADLIVHMGHTRFLQEFEGVVFVPCFLSTDYKAVLEKFQQELKELSPLALFTNAQHIHEIKSIQKELLKAGISTLVGVDPNKVLAPGQVTGCNYTTLTVVAEKAKTLLFYGSGNFHALGAYLITRKPVYVLDPLRSELRCICERGEKVLRNRLFAISKFRDCRNVGITMSAKTGQLQLEKSLELKRKLEDMGKRCILLVSNDVTPEALLPYGMDCYVITACPRIATDEYHRYPFPILSLNEAWIAIKGSWLENEYSF